MKRKILMTKLNDRVTIGSLRRLVEGDLSHIGDAIIEGKGVRNTYKPHNDLNSLIFNAPVDGYEIVKPINKIVIKQCPEIEVVQMIVPNSNCLFDNIFDFLSHDIFDFKEYILMLKPNSKVQSNFIQATLNEGAEIEVDHIKGDKTTTYKLTVLSNEQIVALKTTLLFDCKLTCELTKLKVEPVDEDEPPAPEPVENDEPTAICITEIQDSIDCQSIINDLIDKGYSLRVKQNSDGNWNIKGVL